jgi:N-acetylglutamate synthase-like GNAT family acetyltransferase
MSELVFREATIFDVPEMAQLFVKHSQHERESRMRRRFESSPEGWHVAVWRGQIAGCCQVVWPRSGHAWLQWMRISPHLQGSGIGGSFSAYVEKQAVRQGAKMIRLNTLPSNERVHYMMGGSLGYTEWSRWMRLGGVRRLPADRLEELCEVRRGDETDPVWVWLSGQSGFRSSFETVTCPSDFRKMVGLDRSLLGELIEAKTRKKGCMIAEHKGEIEGIALYAVRGGELRVLQVVAATERGGLAAAAGAVRAARRGEKVSIQVSGTSPELTDALLQLFGGAGVKRHDFYVFGKPIAS